jgi:hypothetical protein
MNVYVYIPESSCWKDHVLFQNKEAAVANGLRAMLKKLHDKWDKTQPSCHIEEYTTLVRDDFMKHIRSYVIQLPRIVDVVETYMDINNCKRIDALEYFFEHVLELAESCIVEQSASIHGVYYDCKQQGLM